MLLGKERPAELGGSGSATRPPPGVEHGGAKALEVGGWERGNLGAEEAFGERGGGEHFLARRERQRCLPEPTGSPSAGGEPVGVAAPVRGAVKGGVGPSDPRSGLEGGLLVEELGIGEAISLQRGGAEGVALAAAGLLATEAQEAL